MSAAVKVAEIEVRRSHLLGYIQDPESFFEREKQKILDAIGDLSGIRIPLNRILVALWITKEDYRTPGGILIASPDKTKDENKWQGVSGLVVKMGPHAYESDENVVFYYEDKCEVGDWVMFRRGEGVRVEVWNHECILLEEPSIKMVLDRPDAVY